jgi:hypothetical protein
MQDEAITAIYLRVRIQPNTIITNRDAQLILYADIYPQHDRAFGIAATPMNSGVSNNFTQGREQYIRS